MVRLTGKALTTDQGLMRQMQFFAPTHLRSAAFFTRQAYAIEQEPDDEIAAGMLREHRAFVIGAITGSVMFLEARINQLYVALAEDQQHMGLITDEARQEITAIWTGKKPRYRNMGILTRYNLMLNAIRQKCIVRKGFPYADVEHLIALRNELTHFSPMWRTIVPPEKHTDQEQYLSDRFSTNPLAHPHAPFLYERCLGHGCAEWAVQQSAAFVDVFLLATELPEMAMSGFDGNISTQ